MTARSPLDDLQSEKLRDTGIKSKASWVWWGMLAACLIVTLLSVAFAVRRASHQGDGRNRGPATEARPGAEPARDIDRSLNR
jgi:hypothetical protein